MEKSAKKSELNYTTGNELEVESRTGGHIILETNKESAVQSASDSRRELLKDWDSIAHFVAGRTAEHFASQVSEYAAAGVVGDDGPLITGLCSYYMAATLLAEGTDQCFGDLSAERQRKGADAISRLLEAMEAAEAGQEL